jgi:quercetin dioxygenase-like cupin family protein
MVNGLSALFRELQLRACASASASYEMHVPNIYRAIMANRETITMTRFSGVISAKTRQLRRGIARFGSLQCLAVGLLASFTSTASAHQRADIVIKQLLSTTTTSAGQKIVLPQNDPELIASIFETRRGAHLQEHEHPYPRYGYILSGSLRVTDSETGRSKTYRTGDFVLEMVGRWHTGANEGKEPTRLLVIDIVEKGHTNTVLK